MAIIRKTEKAAPKFPTAILDVVNEAFEFQSLASYYGAKYDEAKNKVLDAIGNSEEVTLVLGETFSTPVGKIISYDRQNKDYSLEEMWSLVKSGEVSEEDFLSCIRSFDGKKVTKVFEDNLDKVVIEKDPTTVITFKASGDLKAVHGAALEQLDEASNSLRTILRDSLSKEAA